MKLSLASAKESEELKAFHKQFPLVLHRAGRLGFNAERPQSFFDLYDRQSQDHLTYTLREDNGDLQAMATFIFKKVLFRGEVINVAYATDLRVAPNRKATLGWVNNFEPVLKEIIQKHQLKALFSFINFSDSSVLNNFVRPRPMRRPLPRYHLYRKFSLVTLHGVYPWGPEPLTEVTFEQGNRENFPEILRYLTERIQYKDFSSYLNQEYLKLSIIERLKLSPSNFIAAIDSHERVIGCVAVMPTDPFLKIKPLEWSSQAANLKQFLNFASIFGLARPLTQKAPDGEFIPMNLGHFVFAENEDVLEGLFAKAFELFPQGSLSYVQIEQDYKLRAPKNWISTQVDFGLFALTLPGEHRPDFLNPQNSLNPEIEPFAILS